MSEAEAKSLAEIKSLREEAKMRTVIYTNKGGKGFGPAESAAAGMLLMALGAGVWELGKMGYSRARRWWLYG